MRRGACNFAKHCKHHQADRGDLGSGACTPHCIYEYLWGGEANPICCFDAGGLRSEGIASACCHMLSASVISEEH